MREPRAIAHDLNNALVAISGHAELLALKLPDDDPLRRHVQEIRDACKHAAKLTSELADGRPAREPGE